MYYQLPSGKTLNISTEKYLQMSDEDLQYFAAQDAGEPIENPFYGSSLEKADFDNLSDDELHELIGEMMPELPDVDPFDKLEDLDTEEDFFD